MFMSLGLSGTGAGVFTDLGFTFTAVDGGKKCTKRNSKCSKSKRRCSTKDLAVSIEVLSNEVVATGEEVSYNFFTGLEIAHRENLFLHYYILHF